MANRKIGYFCYNTLLALASLFIAPLIIFRLLANYQSRRRFFKEISGISKPIIWIHAATEGQLTYAYNVLKSLEETLSDYQPILTYNGRESRIIQFANSNFIFTVLPYSIDLFSKQIVSRIKPRLLLMVEDCFYPNRIRSAKDTGSKVALINGRVNNRLALVYRLAPAFLKALFEQVDLLIMNSVDEANRIGQVGAKLSSILVSDATNDLDEVKYKAETNGRDSITETIAAIGALLGRNY